MFVFSAITFVKPCTERLLAHIAVNFDSRVVAVVEVYFIHEGINER